KEELIPHIDKKYPTNKENNILYGTSLGGLFSIYAYLNEATVFKSYLTVEPSLWWDKQFINRIASENLSKIKGIKNTLWIGSRDGSALDEMGISKFESILKSNSPEGLSWLTQAYPNETHFSAIWKGIYDGLKYSYVFSKSDKKLINRANAPNKFRLENGSYISFSNMDTFLKSQMDSLNIPGLSFAIINDDQVIYHKNLGVTNMDTKEPVTNETIFDAASMTKTPFALMVLRMVEKGILDLDKPLYTYLPNADIAQDDRYKLITARMVLSHTTGFPNWRFFNKDGKLDIKFTPGTKYLYSGEGYEYLADVLAHQLKISKNDLQEIFNKEIGEPLAMNKTYFTWNDWVKKRRAAGHVDGKVSDGYGITESKPDFYASYSMQTEALNYAKLIISIMKEELLQKSSYNEMLKVQYPTASDSPNSQWGLGIGIRESDNGVEYYHNGFNSNFTSDFMFNKEKRFGYVFFTNCNKGGALTRSLLSLFKESIK
ncbi:MAG: serine hydrolase, partial [Saprospiraceae bacterium]